MANSTDYMIQMLQDLQTSDTMESLAMLQEAAETHPRDPRPPLVMGGIYASGGDMDRAEACYLASLQRDPEFAIARFQLGLLQFTGGRPQVALSTWDALGLLPEEHPLRLFAEGFVALGQDQFEEALRLLREGIVWNRDNPPLNKDMAMIIDTILRERPELGPGAPPEGESAQGEIQPTEVPDADVQGHFLLSAYRDPQNP